VQHFLLEYPRFETQRVALRDPIGAEHWSWPEVAPYLMSTPEVFSLFGEFCRESLWIKEIEELSKK
jgi:hypothetical protein